MDPAAWPMWVWFVGAFVLTYVISTAADLAFRVDHWRRRRQQLREL